MPPSLYDLSAIVDYLTAVSVVGAVIYLIMLDRRHPAIRSVKEIQIPLRSSAVHEAGHAVAAVISGLNLTGVNITQVRKGNGRIQCGECACAFNKRLGMEVAIASYAGPYAQAKAYPLLQWQGADSDFKIAEECLDELDVAVRARIDGLTKDLLRERCKHEARSLVNEHWHSIVKVANELLAKRALTGEEVKALMNQSVMTAEFEAARMPSPHPPPPPLYYFGAWTDTDCLCGCPHFHLTVASAVACVSGAQAGSYVIAVEKGAYRKLNTTEEAEFQELMYGHPERKQADILNWPKKNPEPVD